MRKRRILSLLLAVAVTATMLIAVPLTASAATVSAKPQNGQSFTKGQAIFDDSSNVKILVNAAISTEATSEHYNTDSNYPYSLPFRSDASANISQHMDDPTSFAAGTNNGITQISLIIEPYVSGSITLYIGVDTSQKSRTIKCWDNTEDKNTDFTYAVDGDKVREVTFNVKAKSQYIVYARKFTCAYLGFDFTKASSDPTLTLEPNELEIAPGKTGTIKATLENVEIDTNIEWSSDKSDSGITVEGNNTSATVTVGKQVQIGETATITATAGQLNKTCSVKVVNPAKDIFIKAGNGVKSVTIKNKDGQTESYNKTITWQRTSDQGASRSHNDADASGSTDNCAKLEKVPYGTYTVTTVVEDKYYEQVAEQDINVADDENYGDTKKPLEITTTRSSGATGPIAYEDMYGKTVTWDFSTNTGQPNEYLSVEGNQTDVGVYSDTDGVYMIVDVYSLEGGNSDKRMGKFDAANSKNCAQTRFGSTFFKIPVVPGSIITVTNASGDNKMETKDADVTTDASGFKFTYTGAEEKTVTINIKDGTGDNYISKIEVTSPDPKAYFGKGLTDSGWYQGESGKEGVIRFLQKYVGNSKVDSYGIYFIGPDNDITKGKKITGSGEDLTESGIYADLYGIPEGNDDTYSAKAFVEIDGKPIWSDSFSGKVSDWESDANKIDEYPAGE